MAFVNPTQVIKELNLQEGFKFVDLGAGSGAFVLEASPLVGVTGKVYAVDIQKDILLKLKAESIKAKLTNITFLWCDFEKIGATKIHDNSINVVLISNTLFQLDNKLGAIEEAYRILQPNGHLYIIDWYESFSGMGPDKNRIVTKEEAIQLTQTSGFKQIDFFEPGDHHYGLHFIKE